MMILGASSRKSVHHDLTIARFHLSVRLQCSREALRESSFPRSGIDHQLDLRKTVRGEASKLEVLNLLTSWASRASWSHLDQKTVQRDERYERIHFCHSSVPPYGSAAAAIQVGQLQH